MTTLPDLIKSVKEQKLSREQLESYGDELSTLFALMMLEKSELEKLEAIFMTQKTEEQSVAEQKIHWKGSKEGLRLIEIKNYLIATKEMINSLKSRVYRLIF